jgi:site-specific DNA recombinase
VITKRQVRCAIYTRKSSEEGLEQDFNSLDAQREACAAYIISQKAEGWVAIQDQYDDGGYSGGTLDRPALKRLLEGIENGAVDVVVVYKIDRLSRSLMDFAKLVEVFDRRAVTFVSVTQSFNTTTSMGRLTLNVLLSFAQFEREVTGERIRDKFAASKRKGIWMGGNPPLGYDVRDRKLVVNPGEADTVRLLFERYLELGCVRLLCDDAKVRGLASKLRRSPAGQIRGGKPMGRSALYQILNNRTYAGQLPHKGSWYPGEHPAIVPHEVFDAVQTRFAELRPPPSSSPRVPNDAPYTGLLYDDTDTAMLPNYTVKKGIRYRYYASRPVLKGEKSSASISRIPAPPFEAVLGSAWRRLGLSAETPIPAAPSSVIQIRVQSRSILIRLRRQDVLSHWRATGPGLIGCAEEDVIASYRAHILPHETLEDRAGELILTLGVRAKFRGGSIAQQYPGNEPAARTQDMALIKAMARAHRWRQMLMNGEAKSIEALAAGLKQDRGYIGQTLKLAFLSPELTRMIMGGEQPAGLRLAHLLDADIPLSWEKQRVALLTVGPPN